MTKSLLMRIGFAAALCVGAMPSAFAQDQYQWARDMFKESRHDFGVVAKNSVTKHRFVFTNKYKETVHVASVTTSCGCSGARASQDTLQSNESAYIEVTMNTEKFVNIQKNSTITVTFDRPFTAVVTLSVSFFARTDVLLTPGIAQFGSVAKGNQKTLRLDVAYAGRSTWKITDVVCRNPNLKTELKETIRDGLGRVNYDLNITLKDTAPLGEVLDHIRLKTDDPANPEVVVLVEGRVESEYTVQPSLVTFGNVPAGQKKTVNVVVRGRKPFKIAGIESEKSNFFSVSGDALKAGGKALYALPITLNAPGDSVSIDELFTVSIEGVQEPLTFRVLAKVVNSNPASTSPPTTQSLTTTTNP
jgi:hypothetical protein